jgi:cell division protein FtsB
MEPIINSLHLTTSTIISVLTALIIICVIIIGFDFTEIKKLCKANKQLHHQKQVFEERNKDLEQAHRDLVANVDLLHDATERQAAEYLETMKEFNALSEAHQKNLRIIERMVIYRNEKGQFERVNK